MYGYVVPLSTHLRSSDFVLYRAFYCGVCCQTGKLYGQLPRLTTNYDFAFFTALLHDYASADILIEEHGCLLNAKKKAILQPNPLLERISATSIMLAYQKAEDGVRDGDGIKYRFVRNTLKKPFAKAKSDFPDIWKRLAEAYEAQRLVEEQKPDSIDRAADAFASMLRDLPEVILGKTDDNMRGLCYNIGKFVYLVDALDDIAEDHKSKRYNPFLASFGGEFTTRKRFIEDNREKLEFILLSVCGRAEECFNELKLTQSRSLLRNIVADGLRDKVKELLDSSKKLPTPRL